MSIYNINFGSITEKLLPPKLRRNRHTAWLRALTQPLQELRNDTLDDYRSEVLERTKYNSQVIVLEAILNKRYNITTAPFIYIINLSIDNNGVYISQEDDDLFYLTVDGLEEDFIGSTYSLGQANFKIMVPVATVFTVNEMRSLVDRLKLYGTTYLIETY